MSTKMIRWFCRDCEKVLDKPLMCVGNHDCMKCENCRGTSIEVMHETPVRE